MKARKATRRPLEMGSSHSLRINKDYVSQDAIKWLNEQENANEMICRAVDFYYRYFETEMNEAEVEVNVNVKSTEANEGEAVSDLEALNSLANMINSVKR